jgi:hypothetical protein
MTCHDLPERTQSEQTQRIDTALLDPWRRFDRMAISLADWATKWSTTTLARWLHVEQLPLEEHERALVALALKGTVAAGIVIDDYNPAAANPAAANPAALDPCGRNKRHRRFYEVVCIEWQQRHQTTGHRLAA